MSNWHDFLEARVKDRPDAPAFEDDGGTRWSYADLDRAAAELGRALSDAGVRRNDRVLILAENCCSAVAALFACSRIGACAMPVNARQTAGEVGRVIEHTQPAAVLLASASSSDAAEHSRRLDAIHLDGAFGALHMACPYPSDPDPNLDDVAVMLFTTGTTGAPKGVMLTHENLCFAGRSSVELRGLTGDDVIYGVLPITHVFGLASVVTAAICAGALVRLEARFSAVSTYEALNSGITLFSAVPQMHALLMQYTKEQGHDRLPNNTLRYASSGAAPLDPAWKREAEAFYGIALQNGYGMTECTAAVSMSRNALGDPDISVGPPIPEVEIRIDQMVEGGGDGVGEVLLRGPNVMKGYYRNPDATLAAFDGVWLRTGDLGQFDERGHLHIVGRCKELIIHGGFNVYPPEVETALNDHALVVQSAVVGRVVDGDEKVVAFVQVADDSGLTEAELLDFVADRLAGYKRPSQIVVARELPASATGKILKHQLLKVFADRLR